MPNSDGLACDDPAMNLGQPVMTDQVERLSDSWDAHAHEWIKWVRAPGRQDSYWRFHRKRFLALVPHAGRLTVDIGCGEGRVGRDLQRLGHTMLGVDLSSTMCRAAATHPEPQPVVRADASKLPLPDASADCAIAFMSLQDIDDMPSAVTEIARILEDDCLLLLAIVHPMYSGGRFSGHGKFSRTGKKSNPFIIKRSYLENKRLVSTDVHGGLRVTFFREHRPLQVYTQALIRAGFNIENLLELTDENQSRDRNGIPVFLDIVARRRPRDEPVDSAQKFDDKQSDITELQPFGQDCNDDETYPPHQWLRRAPLLRMLSAQLAISARRTEVRVGIISISGVSGLIAAIALFASFH